MKVPGVVQRHPELGWLIVIVVIVAAGTIGASALSGVFHEDSGLPATSSAQVMNEITHPSATGYYGTVDTSLKLGLPARLAKALAGAAPAGNLLRGSHRLRYWYGDPEHWRVATISETSEQDVFREGSRTWDWNTATRVARRGVATANQDAVLPLRLASAAALTPPQLAAHLLAVVGSQSESALRGGDAVGGRQTYQLVLSPRLDGSRIGEIDIDVDGSTGVPLRVRIFSTEEGRPVLDVSFEDDIRFGRPDSSNFEFRLPQNAEVKGSPTPSSTDSALDDVALLGGGWLTVASYTSDVATGKSLARIAYRLLDRSASPEHGPWGRGRLVVTPIMTVLVTRSGEILAGPVKRFVLFRSAG